MTTYNALTEGCYGDGVHDDTSALQTILDALTASDKLYLPAGSYLLSYPGIAPPSGAYVYGVGPTSILYHPDDGEYRNMIELSGVTSCTMRDLKIMSSLAGTASKVRGIHGNGSAVNVTLRRITLDRLQYGIKIDGTGNSGWDVDGITCPKGAVGDDGICMPLFMEGVSDSTFSRMWLWANSVETGDHHLYIAANCTDIDFSQIVCVGGVGHDLHLYGAEVGSESARLAFSNVVLIDPAWSGVGVYGPYTAITFDGLYGTATDMNSAPWFGVSGVCGVTVNRFALNVRGGNTAYLCYSAMDTGGACAFSAGSVNNSAQLPTGLSTGAGKVAATVSAVVVSGDGPRAQMNLSKGRAIVTPLRGRATI